jgi:hypothetical protein
LRVDLTDEKGEMTITLNAHTNFIEQHKTTLFPRKTIFIANLIAPKTNYDHGEDKYISLVEQETSIENIASVCQEYNFILDTSIKRILATIE